MNKIKIALIEDDPGWLKAMVSFLNNEDDLIVMGTAMNRNDGLSLANILPIDVFLVDVNLSGNKLDGIYAAIEIQQVSECKIIMLTCLKEEKVVADSFAIGAAHFITKDNYKELPKVIRDIYNNSFSPIGVLAQNYSQLRKENQLKELTYSERKIYDLIEQGYTRSQIEKELIKTKNTLKIQIRKILSKLNVSTSKEAVKKIRFNGFYEDI